VSFTMAPGAALPLPPGYRPGKEAPPRANAAPVKVPRVVAARARYVGAMMWTEEYGVLAVFQDPETGRCYAQPAGE
jgi:hypothetical protein